MTADREPLEGVFREASLFALLRALGADRGPAPLGGDGPVRDETVRLRGHPSLGFPTRDVAAIDRDPDGRVRLDVTFLTLYGADSPLPLHDSIRLLRADDGDTRARDLIDVVHHRLLSTLYRTWARTRPYTAGGRWSSTAAGRLLVALVDPTGTGGAAAWDRAELRFQGRRSAGGLARRLQALFPGATVRVEAGVPERVPIPDDQRCRLGAGASRLGEDCVLGGSLWNATGRFRVHLGPLDREAFEGLAPGGPLHRALTELVDSWLDVPLDWTLRVTLKAEAASAARLGAGGPGRRLGVDTWLGRPTGALVTTELPPFVSLG